MFSLLLLLASPCSYGQPAALIPMPGTVVPAKGKFPLCRVGYIVYATDSLKSEALVLQRLLAATGVAAKLRRGAALRGYPYISLQIGGLGTGETGREAYRLDIAADRLLIRANSRAGIFYGIQTLKQLWQGRKLLAAVSISDAPAFPWRGYMVDVARNYQSVALLKQQIDRMAEYKLNVLHLHLTEDIAWRLEIKRYPQLTSPLYMERNRGAYYTVEQIRELIGYCRERHILLVPEIDMPGHSAAFKRAMKVDMQSDSGVVVLKNILGEIARTYDISYLHIGADEVKITNGAFVPEISAFLGALEIKVLGWEPGGNYGPSTIRQLWMDEAGLVGGATKIRYIDSRHLYLNHMDPLESVVTIFNRQLAGVDRGSAQALGATLCLWHDRAVARESDLLAMNGVYPAMLAFAERSWLGNGYGSWVANMALNGSGALRDFRDFEDRLMVHKRQFFKGLPFPYQQQSRVSWRLFGPYANDGDLARAFPPEKQGFRPYGTPGRNAIGGTIILRHWWAPKILGVLEQPLQNTTWYAFTRIWAERAGTKKFWIGFTNPSRSQATDSPPAGQWDFHHSAVWLNGKRIDPPLWARPGAMGDLEMPLIDEGYEYRAPTVLRLQKGWNTIRIKAPIGSFRARNWNNPEKWMFTFVEVEQDRSGVTIKK